jgi:HlyD family secretion protein
MSVRRSLGVLFLVIVLLPLVVFTTQNRPSNQSNAEQLRNLQVYEVQRGTVALSVSAIGRIEADQSVELSFLAPGEVQEVLVERDDYVLAGDPLVRLDNTNQRIAYEQALLAVDQSELQLQDLLTVDDSQIRLAEAAVDAAWGTYLSAEQSISDEDISAAELAYQQAQEGVEAARIERDRIGGQFGGDSTEWESANARLGEATFQAEIARLQAQQLRTANQPQLNAAYAGVIQAQRELDRVQAGPADLDIDNSETAIIQAENQLERAETSLNRTTLEAPFDGVISALNTEVGGLVAPGVTVVELTDISPLRLTVQVDEIDIDLVEVNQPVRVVLDALPDTTFPATVTDIAPLGTPSGGIVTYDVGVALDVNDPRVRVGMTAEATIVIDEETDVLSVPNLYIRRQRGEQASVTVLTEDNTLEEVEVTLGIQGRESSEITDGLDPGDLVAVSLGGGLNILGE